MAWRGLALPAHVRAFAQPLCAAGAIIPSRASPLPDWLRGDRSGTAGAALALRMPRRRARPVIAICIDDLGEDLAGTDRAMALPKQVALSFLPFAETTPFLARSGRAQGP